MAGYELVRMGQLVPIRYDVRPGKIKLYIAQRFGGRRSLRYGRLIFPC
jgi:hypothetical protein